MSLEDTRLWEEFSQRHSLHPDQLKCFKEYYHQLVSANALFNITAILDLKNAIHNHFNDSLALKDFINCSILKGIGDIGTGGGFPAIPLKILYPELPLVLIEVNAKKRLFLKDLITHLGLADITISELDWRTFLRKTDYQLDTFTARASLKQEELMRMFMPSSPYRYCTLYYWASSKWVPSVELEPSIKKKYFYTSDSKERLLIQICLPE